MPHVEVMTCTGLHLYNASETVDYHNIKTFKIKIYKTQQFVSPVNGILRGKSYSITFTGKNKLLGFIGF